MRGGEAKAGGGRTIIDTSETDDIDGDPSAPRHRHRPALPPGQYPIREGESAILSETQSFRATAA